MPPEATITACARNSKLPVTTRELLSPRATLAKLQSIEHQMGYDKSLVSNYATFVKGVFVGRDKVYADGKYYNCPAPCFGISITTDNPVWSDLKQKYPATLTLAIGGAAIYLGLGVFLGAMAARWRGTSADRLLVGVARPEQPAP